jgi:hypothetical protein
MYVAFVYVVDLVGISTACGMDCWGLISGRDKRLLSILQCPDWLWDALSLLSNGYRELCPKE